MVKLGKLSNYLQNPKFPLTLKKKIFLQCVVPTLLYASETWATSKSMEDKLRATQMATERKMLAGKTA